MRAVRPVDAGRISERTAKRHHCWLHCGKLSFTWWGAFENGIVHCAAHLLTLW